MKQVSTLAMNSRSDLDIKVTAASRPIRLFLVLSTIVLLGIILDYNFIQSPFLSPEVHETNVIENLVSNAFKYSEEESPKVGLNFNDKSVTISVEDKGLGIPEGEVEKLFQPFQRADNVADIQGTGLGLVIAKEYVELNGGNIDVESIENEGTKVSVSFPTRVKNSLKADKPTIIASS